MAGTPISAPPANTNLNTASAAGLGLVESRRYQNRACVSATDTGYAGSYIGPRFPIPPCFRKILIGELMHMKPCASQTDALLPRNVARLLFQRHQLGRWASVPSDYDFQAGRLLEHADEFGGVGFQLSHANLLPNNLITLACRLCSPSTSDSGLV